MGVDIPDIYLNIYNKSNPHNEKVDVNSLDLILQHLSGLSLSKRQKITSLVVSPEATFVTRNEFNAFLALIACAQKNMDISIENIYTHRTDLPIPNFKDLKEFNIKDLIKDDTIQKPKLVVSLPHFEDDQSDGNYTTMKEAGTDSTSSNSNTVVNQNHESEFDPASPSQIQLDQEALNEWIKNSDHISVSRTMVKEGFLFKHINYEVESENLKSKVLRRFSDFFWLWEILLKRYPFRTLPNLPPKKLGGRDDIFEERRRKGLVRFINGVAWHPVLGKDSVVVAFLSNPSEISSWKRANPPVLDEEFVRKSHNITYLERLIPMDLDDRIIRMKKRLSISIQQYEHMCFIMNQMNRLKKALGTDYVRYSATLNSVSELDKQCWVPDCHGCSQVVGGYNCIVKSMHQAGMLLNKQVMCVWGFFYVLFFLDMVCNFFFFFL
ncbi:unnamed protein product [Mucor hiemalis]